MTKYENESEKAATQIAKTDGLDDDLSVDQWLNLRKEAALKIDPETAEVSWTFGCVLDPYGVEPELPEEQQCIGRLYFARSPDSDIWVSFYDLPKEVLEELWGMLDSKLAASEDNLDWLLDD